MNVVSSSLVNFLLICIVPEEIIYPFVYGTFMVVIHTGWVLAVFSAFILSAWGDQGTEGVNGFWKVVGEFFVGEVQKQSLKMQD